MPTRADADLATTAHPPEPLGAEARLELALDAGAIAGTWFWNCAADVFTADERFARSFGLDGRALARGMPLAQVVQRIHPADEPRVRALIDEALAAGGPYRAEYRVFSDCRYRWIEANGRVDLDASGRPARFPGVLVDIDRRKRSELRLTAASRLNESLRALVDEDELSRRVGECIGLGLEAERAAYGVVDPVAIAIEVFADWREDASAPDIRGIYKFFDFGTHVEDLLRGETVRIADVRIDPRTRLPADRWEALGARAVLNAPLMAGGALRGVAIAHSPEPRDWDDEEAAFALSVADRAWTALAAGRAEHALRAIESGVASEVRRRLSNHDMVWRLSRDLMLVARFDGVIEAVNPAWSEMLGWSTAELVGSNLLSLVHPEDVERTAQGAAALSNGGALPRFDNRCRRQDGSHRWINWTAAPGDGLIVAVGRDVTPERDAATSLAAAEAQLRQAQKMEAVGQLTGGLAHDFNNLLSTISLSLDVLRMRAGSAEREETLRHVALAAKGVRSAASLNQRLLAFSRKQSLDARDVDVDRLAAEMAELLRRTLGERVSISTATRADGWLAKADASQLESALMNLAINARDAMPEGGSLAISTGRLTVSEGAAPPDGLELVTGDYASLSVEDTGSGMSPDVAARAFDPFFTTKGIGKGSGLGLSMIHGFARQSGGDARIETEPGRGTKVTICLPRAVDARPDAAPAIPAAPALGRGQRVLLVEDEPDVRAATAEALLRMGYAPRLARDAEEALAILAGADEIDVVVTDVGLPGLDGRALARRARELRPGMKALLVTGYAAQAEDRVRFLEDGMDMLIKPYALDDLAAKLAKLLDA